MYEVTGGQQIPGAQAVDFVGLARAAGFTSAVEFHDLADWRTRVSEALAMLGPRFIRLVVNAAGPEFLAGHSPPMGEQLAGLQSALQAIR
jgi:thiamine pyrophosphate-dependent acetolactate synthase large subunit-like protein